jgi:biopolymer transport protein ExbD
MKVGSSYRRRHSRIEIIPLIDIMFFLLASFMMVSLNLDRSQNIRVDLPTATQAQHDFKPDMLNIAVDKGGKVWVEKKEISLPNLRVLLSNRFRVETNLPVYITGDRDTLHGAMAEVYDVVRGAGVQKVAFAMAAAEGQR